MLKSIVRTLRVGQFVLALVIFTFVALMPASLVKAPQADTTLHFFGNLLLLLSAWLACYGRYSVWLVLAFLAPYSLLVEVAQWLAPTRVVDSRDMAANLLGLGSGAIIAFIADRALRRMPRVRSYLTKH